MKRLLVIAALLLPVLAQAEGLRKVAGDTFLEPVQPRDSILIADQLRYGMLLENVTEGTPLALPEFKAEQEDIPLVFVTSWQLDSTRVSKKKEQPARYDIKAWLTLTAFMGGTYELPDIPVILDGDTLVFRAVAPMEVKELPVDMESFQPNDIKDQVKFPYTFKEVFPWVAGGLLLAGLITFLVLWLLRLRRKKEAETRNAEPPHIRALRKLDKFRSDKYWKPDQQKTFYSGVTDALREYIAARYGVGALEMTTAEIFAGLKTTDVPADLYEEMKDLFERADFVKFAKFTATDEENAKVLPGAVRFVTATYQQEIDMGSSHPSGDRDDNVIPSEASVSQKKEE